MTLELTVRTAVLLAVVFGVARALPRASAATRHALWRASMTAALLLPLVTEIAPAWTLVSRDRSPTLADAIVNLSPTFRVGADPSAAPRASELQGPPSATTLLLRPGAWGSSGGSDTPVASTVWMLGVIVILSYYAVGYVGLQRICRRARPAPTAWRASSARLSTRLALGRVPDVRVSREVPGPLVAGLSTPTILIPPEAAGWPADRRDAVLVHELAHIVRRDLAAQVVAQIVCALHWFNPLAWMAARAMRRERELACDDVVLACGVASADYATDLLAIATHALERRAPAGALSMARPSEIESRLLAVLGRRPRRMSTVARWAVPGVVAVATLSVAGATIVRADEPTPRPQPRRASAPGPLFVLPSSGNEPTSSPEHDSAISRNDPDPRARERAVVALAVTPGRSVVPALIDAVQDRDPRVREKAVAGLMWRRAPGVLEALVSAASDPEASVREKAVVALGMSRDPQARAAVARARHDPDDGVRDKASKIALLTQD
jgi:beta-lactamase regulating signal transducer with metallopeptidase domain